MRKIFPLTTVREASAKVFRFTPISIRRKGKKQWPRLKTVSIGKSNSVTIMETVHGESLFIEALLEESHEIRERETRGPN